MRFANKMIALSLPLLLVAGCETMGESDRATAETARVAQAQQTADNALAAANRASERAEQAARAADQAAQAANRAAASAEQAANEARSASDRADRMFQQGLRK